MGQVCFVLHAVRSRGQNFRLSSSTQFSKCFSLIGQSNDLFNFRRVVMQMGSIIHSGEKDWNYTLEYLQQCCLGEKHGSVICDSLAT